MSTPDKGKTRGIQGEPDPKGRIWIRGRRGWVVKDTRTDVSSQGGSRDDALENLHEANELDKRVNPQNHQDK